MRRAHGSVACAVTAFVLTACTHQTPAPAKTFRTALTDDVKTWDPASTYDAVSLDVTPSVFEALFQYSYLRETLTIEPLLAAKLPEFSRDRKTVTLTLKKGIHFQDDPCFKEGKGREVTAQDFVYAWKRIAHPDIPTMGMWIFEGKVVGFSEFHEALVAAKTREERTQIFEKGVAGLKVLDDSRIEIKLTAPYPQLPQILAMNFTAPVAHEMVQTYGDEKGQVLDHPIGTGPFILKEWKRNARIVLERNPTFHGEAYPTHADASFRARSFHTDAGKPLPFLDRLEFEVIREQQPTWLSFLKGKLDSTKIPKDRFQQVITNHVNLTPDLRARGVHLEIDQANAFYYVTFNFKDPLIGKNKYLRQALSSAVNREQWIETFTNGTGRKMTTALPTGIPDRPTHSQIKYDFNLSRARELLAKAGYPGGKGLPQLTLDMRGSDSYSRQLGDFFSQAWEAIGVHITVTLNTLPAWLEKQNRGNFQIGYGGWGLDYPDAQNVYQVLYGKNIAPGPNEANFVNVEFDRLYERMEKMPSGPERAALIEKIDAIAQEEVPWGYGYYHSTYHLAHPWVFNYRSSEIIQNRHKYIRVMPEIRARYLDSNR